MALGLLALPLVISYLKNLVDGQELKSIKETLYESYLSFFFLDTDTPMSVSAKIIDFFYSLFVLVYLSFYIGIMTKEYFDYKSFGGVQTLDDIIGKKIYTGINEVNMILSLGGKLNPNSVNGDKFFLITGIPVIKGISQVEEDDYEQLLINTNQKAL
jgi:hypothetical protein